MPTKKLTFDTFIERAVEKHGTFYDYSKIQLTDSGHIISTKKKVDIICPLHGPFKQTPANHFKSTCKQCSFGHRSYTSSSFIEKLKTLYGTKYNYDLVKFENYDTKIILICNKHDTRIKVSAKGALTKPQYIRCSSCRNELYKKQEVSIDKIKQIHGDDIDLSRFVFNGIRNKSTFGCEVHGWFDRVLCDIIAGAGCPKCGVENKHNKFRLSKREMLGRCRIIHGEKYNYDFSNYYNLKSSISIKCPEHGNFNQTIETHLNGSGCPLCAKSGNISELEIFNYLLEYFGDDAQIINGIRPIFYEHTNSFLELDIYFPEHKLAIEYNGHQHYHKDSYFNRISKSKTSIFDRDEYKRQWCEERNIKLIEIPYWEFSMQHTKQERDEYLEDLTTLLEEYL